MSTTPGYCDLCGTHNNKHTAKCERAAPAIGSNFDSTAMQVVDFPPAATVNLHVILGLAPLSCWINPDEIEEKR
jgi:hypothetical protein